MSVRQDAFAAVRTDLAAINGAGVYSVAVARVYEDLVSVDNIRDFPAIVMVRSDDKLIGDHSLRGRHFFAGLTLLLFLQRRSEQDVSVSAAVDEFVTDVQKAMTGTTKCTHGDTCIQTYYRGHDPIAEVGSAICGAVMRYDLELVNTWDAP